MQKSARLPQTQSTGEAVEQLGVEVGFVVTVVVTEGLAREPSIAQLALKPWHRARPALGMVGADVDVEVDATEGLDVVGGAVGIRTSWWDEQVGGPRCLRASRCATALLPPCVSRTPGVTGDLGDF